MKKLLMLLCAMTMVFGMVGFASAISYTETLTLNVIIGEGPIADFIFGDTFSYSHATPAGFEVPYDYDVSAFLTISGYWIDDSDDRVEVSGSLAGHLTSGGSYYWSWSSWSWIDSPSISTFDVSPAFSTWTEETPLVVDIIADGSFGDGFLVLGSSTLDLSWTDGTALDGTAPVPEPATILLMGTGLLGLVAYSRKRYSKKS